MIREIFRRRAGAEDRFADRRARQILESPARLVPEVRGWLDEATRGVFVDLGCGPGMLLAAAARDGRTGVGIDVCLSWLVVAKAFVRFHGGNPILAAAFAESQPLPDGAVDGVIALDVIEHVADPVPMLREADRVTRAGGTLALATPNRYSVTPEPHVNVWGVGLLPRGLQQRYVTWRSGKPYDFVRLLSAWELRSLLREHTSFEPELQVPAIPASEIAHFGPRRATLARIYNGVARRPWTRPFTMTLGPFFRVVARKRHAVARAPALWRASHTSSGIRAAAARR